MNGTESYSLFKKEEVTLSWIYVLKMGDIKGELLPRVMEKNTKREGRLNGAICGDSEREFQTSSENKGKQEREFGDVFIHYSCMINI